MMIGMVGRATLAACLLVVAAGCSRSQPTPELREIPSPDLTGAEDAVRRQIESKLEEVTALRATAGTGELSQTYGDLGLLYLTYSFLGAAEISFDNARILAGDDPRWPYLLGYLFEIQGRLEEASDMLERALELSPDDAPALIRLGRVRLELGAGEQARPLFERVLAANPESAAALDGLGKVAAQRGDAARAVDYFERAVELQPNASSVYHALGLAYRKTGDLEKAEINLSRGGDAPVLFVDPRLSSVAELGRSAEIFRVRADQALAEGRYDQAAADYRRALEVEPTDFATRKGLGFCLEKLGDVEGATAQLEEALRTGTTGEAEQDVIERSELLRVLGGLRVLQGRELDAIEAFERALELDPERLNTRFKLANALARQGRMDAAAEHYDQVLAAQPDNAEVLIKRATARINLGQSQAAIADFRSAVEAAPADARARLRFAEALEYLGDPRAAAEQRALADELASEDPEERSKLAALEGGKRLARGDLEGALERFREATRLDAANTDARYRMATILAHQGRFTEALDELAVVIAAAPRHSPARRAEVTALLLQERYLEARGRLRNGLEAMPRERELAHALARLLAVAPVPGVRDGELALKIATKVHSEAQRSDTAETLAMAFAEAGRFAEARELQRQLVNAAERNGSPRMVGHWECPARGLRAGSGLACAVTRRGHRRDECSGWRRLGWLKKRHEGKLAEAQVGERPGCHLPGTEASSGGFRVGPLLSRSGTARGSAGVVRSG